MKKYAITNPLHFLLFLSLILFSCQNAEEVLPDGLYTEGVFISNEGNFSDLDGSAGFYSRAESEYSNKIFEKENGRPFGGLLQSVGFHGEYGYLIDNFGSKIEVVDANSFKSVKTILAGLSLPRYFIAEGSVGFISNWGPYADDFTSPESFVAVLDTEQNLLGEKITVPSRPEGLIISNGKLFVTSLTTGEITVIDISTLKKVATINTGFGPSHFVVDSQGYIWVTCTEGLLQKIDPANNLVLEEYEIGNLDGKFTIDNNGESLYLLTSTYAPDFSFTENSVLKFNLSSPGNGTIIFTSKNLYGIGIDPSTDIIYLANSNAFLGNGTIIRIDANGSEIDNFPSGRGPNGFVFR